MMVTTHLVVGYVLGHLSQYPTLLLVVGSVLPDVLDRGLATVGVADDGHTVGHSLPVVLPTVGVLAILFQRPGVALGIGVVGHLTCDLFHQIGLNGVRHATVFVLWPLSGRDPVPPSETLRLSVGPMDYCTSYVGIVTEVAIVAVGTGLFLVATAL